MNTTVLLYHYLHRSYLSATYHRSKFFEAQIFLQINSFRFAGDFDSDLIIHIEIF